MSQNIGSFINSITLSSNGLYYLVQTSGSDRIMTYYHCLDGCSVCEFPNNCINCQQGYNLNNGICSIQNTDKPND